MILVFAGALQIVIAGPNVPLAWMLKFGKEHRRLAPIVRQIHQAHHVYIVGLLVVFGALSLGFPDELSGGGAMGRFLSGVLALFWCARLLVQRFYDDREFLRRHRAGDLLFAFLAGVYAAAAAGALR